MERSNGIHILNGYIEGLLYDLGPYPGLKPGQMPVTVELYKVDNLERIDMLEGYPYLYDRKLVPVYIKPDLTGKFCTAWTYYFNDDLTSDIIESGDWNDKNCFSF